MAVKKWVGAESAKWSVAKNWSPEGVPGVTSEVEVEGTHPLEVNTAAGKCKQLIVVAGYAQKLVGVVGEVLLVGTTTGTGTALKLTSEVLWEPDASFEISFVSTSGVVEKITTAGRSMRFKQRFEGAGGKWQMADAWGTAQLGTLILVGGTLDTNGQTVQTGMFEVAGGGTPVLKLGASTINVGKWNVTTNSPGFVEAGTSSITVTEQFKGSFSTGAETYATVTVAGTEGPKIEGNSTIATLNVNTKGAAEAKGLLVESGSTTTITTGLTTNGTEAEKARLESITAGSRHKLKKTSGTVEVENLIIKDSEAEGGATWIAGKGCVDGGNNVGWKFEEVAAAKLVGSIKMVMSASGAAKAAGAGKGSAAMLMGSSAAAKAASAGVGAASMVARASGPVKAAGAGKGSARVVMGASGAVKAAGAPAGASAAIMGAAGVLSSAVAGVGSAAMRMSVTGNLRPAVVAIIYATGGAQIIVAGGASVAASGNAAQGATVQGVSGAAGAQQTIFAAGGAK